MEMIPVESSNVKAIGYLDGLMRVQYKDGAEYDYPGVSVAQHACVMAAESKGKAIRGLLNVRAGVTLKRENIVLDPSLEIGMRDGPIHTSQAEGCCAKYINNASLSGKLNNVESFECPKCGTVYRPKSHGPLVNWEASADVLVFKL